MDRMSLSHVDFIMSVSSEISNTFNRLELLIVTGLLYLVTHFVSFLQVAFTQDVTFLTLSSVLIDYYDHFSVDIFEAGLILFCTQCIFFLVKFSGTLSSCLPIFLVELNL